MLEIIVCFFVIILIVPVLYLAENYLTSTMPGQGKSYILQPIYRIIKLFGKKKTEKLTLTAWFSLGACFFSLAALFMTVAGYNFLFIISALIMMELFIITGACSSSDFSGQMSGQRGISRFIIWVFTSFICAASIYSVTGTLEFNEIANDYRLIKSLPFTFASLFVVLLMKGNLLYFNFDISGNETSFLGSALYSPYSGWGLAVIQFTQWIEIGIWLKVLSNFLPLVLPISFLVIALFYLACMILNGFIPKIQWKEAARYSWILAGGMSIVNFLWLYLF